MFDSKHPDPPSATHSDKKPTKVAKMTSWHFPVVFTIIFPIMVASIFFWLEPFQSVHFPVHMLSWCNVSMKRESEVIGAVQVAGPEDLVYDELARVIYTGCWDGWIKRVTVNESVANSVVRSWVHTGGRPLGLALGQNGELFVADSEKGLVRVTREEEVEVLADEVDGLKFKLTDGVDVAQDGTIYFTDASYKYSVEEFIFDLLEGKPHGRFMSYDPSTNHTTLLASNLYFANGVVVSPDQQFVVFCETPKRRCRKYYIQGPKKGSLEKFIDDLPGLPDNIHYGEGHYWIAMATSPTYSWDLVMRYPLIEKAMAMIVKYGGRAHVEKNGGVLVVNLKGKPIAHYYNPQLSLISSGIKIGNHIYCGSLLYPFILRLDVNQYPTLPIS